jgi:Flp pilus assembly protein TadD
LKKLIILTIGVVWLAGCAVNRYRSDFQFANKLAEEGLWKEAHYRMQKALAVNDKSPALHNNLAVILEGLNRLPEAEREYQLAMKLDPKNTYIISNYDRFKKNLRKNENEK